MNALTIEALDLPVRVVADVLPGKPDPAAEAAFANFDRAAAYAQMLADTGDYKTVWISENGGNLQRFWHDYADEDWD